MNKIIALVAFLLFHNWNFGQIKIINDTQNPIKSIYLLTEEDKCNYNKNTIDEHNILDKKLEVNQEIVYNKLNDPLENYSLIIYDDRYSKYTSENLSELIYISKLDLIPSSIELILMTKKELEITNLSDYSIYKVDLIYSYNSQRKKSILREGFQKICPNSTARFTLKVESENTAIKSATFYANDDQDTISKTYKLDQFPNKINFSVTKEILRDSTIVDVEIINTIFESLKSNDLPSAFEAYKKNISKVFWSGQNTLDDFIFGHSLVKYLFGDLEDYKLKDHSISRMGENRIITMTYETKFSSGLTSQSKFQLLIDTQYNGLISLNAYHPSNILSDKNEQFDAVFSKVLKPLKKNNYKKLDQYFDQTNPVLERNLNYVKEFSFSKTQFKEYYINRNNNKLIEALYELEDGKKLMLSFKIPQDYENVDYKDLKLYNIIVL